MSSVYQDIQAVRSLRKELRDINLSKPIMNAIETVHGCIQSGTDLNGWRKVNWRSSAGGPTPSHNGNSSSGRSNNNDRTDSFRGHSTSHHHNSKGNGFFRTNAGGSNNTASVATPSSFSSRNYSNHSVRLSGENTNRFKSSSNGSTHGGAGSGAGSGSTNESSTPSFPLSNSSTGSQAFTNNSSTNTHSNTPSFSSPHSKYVSKFKKDTDKVDDMIINNIILSKLNKMSIVNYEEIKEFITHIIDSNQTEMTRCFMRLVFQKATVEETFCPLYAKLLSELSTGYPVLLTEMTSLYNSYMEIFEEVDEKDEKSYNELLKRNVEKKYRRGYSQFLAELIKHGVINTDSFMKTIYTIVKQVENNLGNADAIKLNEEYTDCLIRIVNAIKSDDLDEDDDNIEEIREIIKRDISQRIKQFTVKNSDNKGISTKTRFSFLNIYEDIEKF